MCGRKLAPCRTGLDLCRPLLRCSSPSLFVDKQKMERIIHRWICERWFDPTSWLSRLNLKDILIDGWLKEVYTGSWLVSWHTKIGRPQLCAWGNVFPFGQFPILEKSLESVSAGYGLWLISLYKLILTTLSSESGPCEIRPRALALAPRVHGCPFFFFQHLFLKGCPLPPRFCCHRGRRAGQCGAHPGNQVHYCLFFEISWSSFSAFWWLDICCGHWPTLVFSMREQNPPGLSSFLGEVNDQWG